MPRNRNTTNELDAIERCAYCRDYVPVTRIEIELAENDTYLRADVDVCENCLDDLR
ncbi:hypothetical protein [Halomicrococcus sp. SG-WS-1]|uniref:hypothetical protein n=1 Tax=Halomicrococcus sp. SG-WS-1 TaxID=3439057 RepID=UPI003F79B13D